MRLLHRRVEEVNASRMWLSKGLVFLFLGYLISLVTCVNLLDFARELKSILEPVTPQVQNGVKTLPVRQSKASFPRQDLLLPSSWQPITVQCGEAEMAIQVHRDLFQTGHFIQATDLSIGPQACHYSVNETATLIIFKVEFPECGHNLQTTSDSLFYHTSLYYKPGPASNLVIVRKSPVEFPITCHYPWKNNVSSNVIRPTWVPFTSAMSEEGKLYFSLHLMTGDWQAERVSAQYLLGDDLHVQADIRKGNHLPLRLFIDTCMATLTPDGDSGPHYKILDFHGCLIDRTSHDAESSFIIPRSQLETLQFTIPASQIAGNERSLIYIACHLKVTAAAKEPDLLNKACSFNSERKIWLPVEGSIDICNCCETRDCGSRGRHKSNDTSSLHVPSQRKQMPSGTAVVDISKGEMEADLVVGPVLIQKAARNHQRDQVGTEEETLAEGEFPVIEAEADSTVGHHFILKADKALRWLLDSNETMKGNASMKGTILGQILTTTTGILFLLLFCSIV
ncbi:zona pellucida sperm-binding protein 3-like isoform 1-T1 [Liasis olivaceus]